MSKTIRFQEVRRGKDTFYSIWIDDELWFSPSLTPPGWFFWVGMMQQYGGQVVEVEHQIIE